MNLPSPLRRKALACLLPTLLFASTALAQPGGAPVKLVVGYAPGGPADTVARIVAERLTTVLNQPVVVDNRPGAGGMIAAQAVKASPADGSVLFLSNTHTLITVPLTVKAAGYTAARDFKPVGGVASFELALATHPGTGAKTLAQLGERFKSRKAEATVGVPAQGSAPEFMAMKVLRSFGVEGVPVPYKGAAPMVSDLLGGQLNAGVSGVSDFLQFQRSGKLQILAVTRRTPLLPDVPSFEELGLRGLELTDSLGVYAPAATPAAVIARYNTALNQVLALPEVAERLQGHDMTPTPGTPADQSQRLQRIERLLGELVESAGAGLK